MTTVAYQITSLTVVYSMFIQTQIKENIKAPRHWPLCGEFIATDEFPAQRASNAENGPIWWRHHEICTRLTLCCGLISVNVLPRNWTGTVTIMPATFPGPMKQRWRIWINRSHKWTRKSWHNHAKTKHSTFVHLLCVCWLISCVLHFG